MTETDALRHSMVAGKEVLSASKTFAAKHTELCTLLGPHLEFEGMCAFAAAVETVGGSKFAMPLPDQPAPRDHLTCAVDAAERETPAVLEKWGKGEDEFNKIMGTELVPFDIETGTKNFGPEKYFGEIFPALMAVIQAAMVEWGGSEMTRSSMWNVMPPPVQESYVANGVKAVHRLIVAPVNACVAP